MGIKFTTAEDAEIIRLKEQVGGSWKAIQQQFAGSFLGTTRKFNDLQVRYTRSLKPGEKFRAPALALGANAPPAPAPAPPVTTAPSAANPPAQSAQAGAPTRRSARSSAADRHQSKVTTRKTRSSKQAGPATAATPVAPSAPPPSSAASDLPASPTGSNFDPPSVEDIAAVKAGEKPAAVLFPPRALSEISDFDPPSIEDIKARRDGHGGPITTLYPPGSFSAEEPSATAEEELIDLTEAPSALSARSSVRTGRITKPQANSKGKGKAKAPAEPKPKPKKSLEEQLADFVNPKGSKKGEWNDDWWADLAAVNGNTEAPVNHVKKRSQEMGGKVAATRYG